MFTLVGRKAPDFTCPAVLKNGEIVGQYHFAEQTKDKYALVFFYPLNFTFVCPSELVALNKRMKQFNELGVEVIAVSIDSQFSHNAWRNTPLDKGGIGKVEYTLAADANHRICQAYGVEHPEAGVAYRGAFLIDKKGVIRSQMINDLPLGRNIDEIIRLFESIEYHEKHGEVCPAGWNKDKAAMKPTPEGVAKYLAANESQL